jgi:hypothetical protein
VYEVSVSDEAWEFSRDAPEFSQRFTGTFEDGGDTISRLSKLSRDDTTWEDDLQITYRPKHVELTGFVSTARRRGLDGCVSG